MPNFQAIFEAIPGLYLVLTPNFVIVAVSDAYLQATMRKREEILGCVMFDAFPDNPNDPNATGVRNLRSSLENVLKHRLPHTMAVQKYDIRRPESEGGGFEERYWSLVNSPVFGANGEISHIIHRAEDITEFVQMQQQRNEERRINQTLQSRAEQMEMEIYLRAQELQTVNKQLQAANEALSELDRAKTVFFSNVSHEFRTPLTLMLSPTEDALSDTEAPLPPIQRERIEVVQRNGLRLLKLVNTLLDFSHLESGRIQAVYEPTDLATLTAELSSVFRSTIEQTGMQLRVECSTLPEAIFVDREMWEKIVFNLLSNAFKFTLSGKITVWLQWLEAQVQLAVEDTGIGISPEELPHLFERFYRVKGSQGRSIEGSGIGLALVQELVRLHGGTVNVTSVLGQGSCFTVTIPTGAAHLPRERISASRTLASTTLGAMPYLEEAQRWLLEAESRRRRGSKGEEEILPKGYFDLDSSPASPAPPASPARILLADDNADMREYIKRLLSSRYIVQTVVDGIAALAAVRENPPNLLLTDVMMPGMDGFELLRSLRFDAKTQDIPVILLSARAGEESRIAGLEAGADDYLIKPFSARELLARIEANLKLVQLRSTARMQEQTLRLEAEIAQANLQSVLSSLRDGFLTVDRNWCYTYINDRQTEMIGMRREDVIGRNMWELFPDLVGSELYQQLERAMTEQAPIQFEYYYAAWNRWFENRIYPISDGIAILCAEITDRKQAAAALHQTEERFRQMAETIQSVFWLFDPQAQQLLYVSPAYEQIWGRDCDHLYTDFSSWIETIHPDDRERIRAASARCLANGSSDEEYRVVRPDGSIRWVRDRGFVVRDPDGQSYRLAGVAEDITDRQQAEAGRRESEARLRFVLDSSEIGEWDLDLTTQPYTARRSLKHDQIFGYESMLPEWSYDLFLNHVHPSDRASVDEKFHRTLSTYADWNFECRIIHADQSIHWIWARSSAYRDISGTPTRLLGMVVDITARKQSEEALRESERRFRRLVESNLFGVVFGDRFGKLHYANDYLLNLVGYTLEEMQSGQVRWDQLTPPEFASNAANSGAQLSTQGVCVPYEKVYRHKNGQQIPILIAAALLQEPFNEAQEVIAFILDLTQLKRVTEERDRFFNLSLDMLAIGNFDGYLTQVNPAWERKLGFTQTELTTQPYLEFVHPDDQAATLVEAQKLAQGIKTIGFENRYRTKSGSYRWISWSVASLPEQNIFYAAAHDISDRKQAELEREQLLGREQTARAAAERANRIKDEFLAVLSHELRSPLNPILGWSRLLQNGKLNAAKTTVALATIERNAKLQVQLIEDLLDISRILRGKLVLNAMPLDLGSVISGALETVKLAADAKSLQIQTEITPGVSVIADATRLQQVVWNLLSNAVKFTPQGGKIEVSLTSVGNHAQIQVRDTGKGIRSDFLPYMFDHFQQEDGSTTRKFGGLGLGLAIARQIVEMHGGRVFASSPGEGQGATFSVQIPLAPKSVEISSIASSPKSTCDLSGIQVLVVDDEADSREFITFVLEQENAIVTAVSSGFDALQAFSQSIPHIVVSDIGMPQIDGYMLMRQIRMLPSNQGGCVPAIALTAYAAELDQQQAIAAGFQRHIAKPIEPNTVVEIIVELVRRRD